MDSENQKANLEKPSGLAGFKTSMLLRSHRVGTIDAPMRSLTSSSAWQSNDITVCQAPKLQGYIQSPGSPANVPYGPVKTKGKIFQLYSP